MSFGISDEHVALHAAARGWLERHCPAAVVRTALEAGADTLPPFWAELPATGWLGLHIDEDLGGEGFGLPELGVVLAETGRAAMPGPFLPTVLAAAVLQAAGPAHRDRCRALATGRAVGTVAVGARPVALTEGAGGWTVSGTWRPVISGAVADMMILPVGDGRWVVVDAAAVEVTEVPGLDTTRRLAEVTADGLVPPAEALIGDVAVDELAAALFAAEACGTAEWCVETASDHAKVREQFGRPIGQFQAVKHRCADMLLALEHGRAAAWDAMRGGAADEQALTAAVAAAVAVEGAYTCAKDCIQVLGGIGFTWEHDAHIHLKRATAVRLLTGGGRRWRRRAVDLARGGVRRQLDVELPPEADRYRASVREFLDELVRHPKAEWNRRIGEAGYISPHWPSPWGRDAGPVEQLVIDEEFRRARVRRPHLQVGAWALPTIIAHGTPAQQERWIPPTQRFEITWCQMFSEPGAGSDLASLTTKATRTDGGWLLSGQKVWTTMAHTADWAICLARTDPSAPKHEGITCFMVDMTSEGIDVRPLKELTGAEMFNEVFLNDVFVPDDCVVGGVDNGWKAARTTLANERVSMGQGSSMGPGLEMLLGLVPDGADALVLDTVGSLVVDAHGLAVLGQRMAVRAVSGAEPGPESSVRKLIGVEHDQRTQEVGLELLGAEGATNDGMAAGWVWGFLGNRSLTIAGGTSEVQRNVIAERLLGLPRDP